MLFLGLFLLYLLAAAVVGMLFFHLGIRRPCPSSKKKKDITLKGFGVNFSPYKELMRQRSDWLERRPHQSVEVRSFDGVCLYGELFSGKGDHRRMVIALHGYKSSAVRSFAPIAPFYLKQGIDLLLLDSRGHGRSGGSFIGMGVLESRDLLCWMDWAIERMGADCSIYLHGMSMGAAAALMASDRAPSQVKGIIGDSGFSSSLGMARLRARAMMPKPLWALLGPAALWWVDLLCKPLAGYRLRDGDVPTSLSRSHIPILLIHGEKDQVVPLEMCLENQKSCRNLVETLVIPQSSHVECYLRAPKEYESAVLKLLEQAENSYILTDMEEKDRIVALR